MTLILLCQGTGRSAAEVRLSGTQNQAVLETNNALIGEIAAALQNTFGIKILILLQVRDTGRHFYIPHDSPRYMARARSAKQNRWRITLPKSAIYIFVAEATLLTAYERNQAHWH
jgi:hypothetical protein